MFSTEEFERVASSFITHRRKDLYSRKGWLQDLASRLEAQDFVEKDRSHSWEYNKLLRYLKNVFPDQDVEFFVIEYYILNPERGFYELNSRQDAAKLIEELGLGEKGGNDQVFHVLITHVIKRLIEEVEREITALA